MGIDQILDLGAARKLERFFNFIDAANVGIDHNRRATRAFNDCEIGSAFRTDKNVGEFTILETRGAVAQITINRPEKRNALSRDTIREILARFESLRKDDSIAVVMTIGAGDVAYCAGRDLS